MKDILDQLGLDIKSRYANYDQSRENHNLHVSDFMHSAYMEMDEKGEFLKTAENPNLKMNNRKFNTNTNDLDFTIDRPFSFHIVDRTNMILLSGKIDSLGQQNELIKRNEYKKDSSQSLAAIHVNRLLRKVYHKLLPVDKIYNYMFSP